MITCLSPEIIRQIRAGEVIENPAHGIKELLENSIDAGATSIQVSVQNGGLSWFRVSDNGCGIPYEDLPLALVNHATSKFHDLSYIDTLGFRGEALASLNLVADVTVISRAQNEDAWKLHKGECIPTSGCVGTTVTVERLFHDYPARQKFLKSPATEAKRIKDVLKSFALAHPNIAFTYHDKKPILTYPATDILEQRIQQVSGQYTNNVIQINGSCDKTQYHLWIVAPTGQSSIGRHCLVNGRPVKNNSINKMITGLYKGLSDSLPHYVLSLTVPAEEVNSNVHPKKEEVRLQHEDHILKIIETHLNQELRSLKTTSPDITHIAQKIAEHNLVETMDDKHKPLGKAVSIINGNIIISETGDGLLMIDLHAAHERLVLQELLENMSIMTKPITPLSIPLTEDMKENLALYQEKQNDNFMAQYGIKCHQHNDTLIVTDIPLILDTHAVEKWIILVLASLETSDYHNSIRNALSEAACHNAWRAGDSITVERANSFLRSMEKADYIAQCNHGRPTIVKFSHKNLNDLFQR